jgi:cysteine desulfurase family protein (TIGR01976 family)
MEAHTVTQLRSEYPALADGYAYLDGAAGTQIPNTVIAAMADAYRAGLAYPGGFFPASHRATAIVTECRAAIADLVGGDPEGVVLGPNMTTLTYHLAQTLSSTWNPGDEIVVSQLDHDGNVRPWVQAAAAAGVTVRWARVNPATGDLPVGQYDHLICPRTRLVAFTAASNVIGTRPDVAAITDKAHKFGALTYVDGVHATPHGPIDVGALGADFYATSAYKWYGPHVGAVIAEPGLLEELHPHKLAPAPAQVPEKFERGARPFASLSGVVAAVDHLASLAPSREGSRRERLLSAMTVVRSHEQQLFELMHEGVQAMPHVTTYGRARDRTPTLYFTVEGTTPGEVAEHFAVRKVNVWNGHMYAWELAGVLGIRDSGGAVRASLAHYNNHSDVDRFLESISDLEHIGKPAPDR